MIEITITNCNNIELLLS